MEKFKKYIKPIIIWSVVFLIYLIILSITSYTGLIRLDMISKINFVFIAAFSLLLGIMMGKKTSKRGYLEGLKIGSIIVIFMFILNIIFYRIFNLTIFIYYLVIIASSIIGSMIGINVKR